MNLTSFIIYEIIGLISKPIKWDSTHWGSNRTNLIERFQSMKMNERTRNLALYGSIILPFGCMCIIIPWRIFLYYWHSVISIYSAVSENHNHCLPLLSQYHRNNRDGIIMVLGCFELTFCISDTHFAVLSLANIDFAPNLNLALLLKTNDYAYKQSVINRVHCSSHYWFR